MLSLNREKIDIRKLNRKMLFSLDGRKSFLFLNHFFFDSAVPAGARRALFLRKYFFKHHVLTPDSESTQKFVKKCTYSSSGGALCVELRVLKGKIRI